MLRPQLSDCSGGGACRNTWFDVLSHDTVWNLTFVSQWEMSRWGWGDVFCWWQASCRRRSFCRSSMPASARTQSRVKPRNLIPKVLEETTEPHRRPETFSLFVFIYVIRCDLMMSHTNRKFTECFIDLNQAGAQVGYRCFSNSTRLLQDECWAVVSKVAVSCWKCDFKTKILQLKWTILQKSWFYNKKYL